MSMRGLLRRLFRNRILSKRLPASLGGGTVICSPEATLSMLKPGWKSDQILNLFGWARKFLSPGMHVWDVGANQGLFSFAASHVVGETGRVVAFEPDPFLTALMARSTATGTHRGAPVSVFSVALSDTSAAVNHRIVRILMSAKYILPVVIIDILLCDFKTGF